MISETEQIPNQANVSQRSACVHRQMWQLQPGQLTCGHRVDPELGKLLLLLLGHMRGQKPGESAELPVQPADLSGLHVAAALTGQARVQQDAPPPAPGKAVQRASG